VDKKVLIVVPAFNEEKNVLQVIEEIRTSLPEVDILIINDCSTDNTSLLAKSKKDVKVVDLPYNLGIGGAVQTGFRYAYDNGYDYAVQIDGDGQHIAGEVRKLITVIENEICDMVIGSRFLDTKSFRSTRARRAAIRLFYYLYRILIGIKVTDGTSGFRAYNRKCLAILRNNYPDDYPEPEAVVILKKNGLIIREVGVLMRERAHGKSSITPLKSLYYMAKVALSIFFSYLRN
jgi:glycosyltransferase involved in cell wall biosynthesis